MHNAVYLAAPTQKEANPYGQFTVYCSVERYNRAHPNSAKGYYDRGLAYLKQKNNRYLRAIRDFDEAIKRNPHYIGAYTARGWTYLQIGETALARADFDKAEQLQNPTDRPF